MKMKTPQLKQQDIHFVCDPTRPQSLVMLKKIQLIDFLKQQSSENKSKILPNFYFLDSPEICNMQKYTIQGMIRQQINSLAMVSQFCRLAHQYYHENQGSYKIEQFQQKYRRSIQEDKQVDDELFRDYTRECFFYKLLNRLLRGGKDTLELYYAQYFTKRLYSAIKNCYLKEKHDQGNFTCYRGASLSEQQIKLLKENQGNHIQMLGFLSTTMNKQIAFQFVSNAMIEIQVVDIERAEDLDPGYAMLDQKRSNNPHENEVLFNVLSSFRINSIREQASNGLQYWNIKLRYGESYELIKKYRQNQTIIGGEQRRIASILQAQEMFRQYSSQYVAILMCPDSINRICWYLRKQNSLYNLTNSTNAELKHKYQHLYFLLKHRKVSALSQQQSQYISDFQLKCGDHDHEDVQKIQSEDFKPTLRNILIITMKAMIYSQHGEFQQSIKLIQKAELQYSSLIQNPLFELTEEQNNKKLFQNLYLSMKFQKIKQKLQIENNNKQKIEELLKELSKLKSQSSNIYGKHNSLFQQISEYQHFYKITYYDHIDLQERCETLKLMSENVSQKYRYYPIIEKIKNQAQPLLKNGHYKQVIQFVNRCSKELKQFVREQWTIFIQWDCFGFIYAQLNNLIRQQKYQQYYELVQAILLHLNFQNIIHTKEKLLQGIFSSLFSQVEQLYQTILTYNGNQKSKSNLQHIINKIKVHSINYLFFNQPPQAFSQNFKLICQCCFAITVFKIKGHYAQAKQLQEMLIQAITHPLLKSVLKENFEEENSFDMI